MSTDNDTTRDETTRDETTDDQGPRHQRAGAGGLTQRTVAHALFRYWRTDGHGRRYQAVAMRGDVVDVEGPDLEVGERHGALVDGELATPAAPVPSGPATPEVSGGSDPAEAPESATGLEVDPSVAQQPQGEAPPRPKTVAHKAAWVDYAVARGMGREEAEDLTKDELIERFPPD